jgi:hypothetical protein
VRFRTTSKMYRSTTIYKRVVHVAVMRPNTKSRAQVPVHQLDSRRDIVVDVEIEFAVAPPPPTSLVTLLRQHTVFTVDPAK